MVIGRWGLQGGYISFTLFTILTLYSIYKNDYGLVFIGSIVFLIFFYIYFRAFTTLRKWRREIKKYLDREEKYSKHKIILTDESLSVVQDDRETIEKWINFNSAQISNTHIHLEGKSSILIPSKSMSENRYSELRRIISKKIK
jgi:hypothetical protein